MIKIEINKGDFNIEVSGTIVETIADFVILKKTLETDEDICDLWEIAAEFEGK